mmetsp:Transcript_20668/g.48252  ORF Transcript_20668/g.48252 Transcript_20668/m.48252 type:complete len:105 (-) Transcript_20668:59-373(-)
MAGGVPTVTEGVEVVAGSEEEGEGGEVSGAAVVGGSVHFPLHCTGPEITDSSRLKNSSWLRSQQSELEVSKVKNLQAGVLRQEAWQPPALGTLDCGRPRWSGVP